MTRKARRKKLTLPPQAARRHPTTPWVTVGAFVATAALGSARPAAAAHVDLRADPRLSVIDDALQGSRRGAAGASHSAARRPHRRPPGALTSPPVR